MMVKDPIFALIEKHRASIEFHRGFKGEEAEYDRIVDAEYKLLRKLAITKPKSLAGLAAFMKHIAAYPDLSLCDPLPDIFRTASKALEEIAQTDSKIQSKGDVAKAIERSKEAWAAYDAAAKTPDPQDDNDEVLTRLFEKASICLNRLAKLPCADDSEFIEKLKYLASVETVLSGPATGGQEFGSIVLAVDQHFLKPSKRRLKKKAA